MGNELKFKATLDDNVSGKLGKIRTEFDRLGGKGSAASLFGNVGAKAVAAGFNLIATAASGAADFVGDAIKAAMDEEASIRKLTTALHANIPAWDGNTAAIERVLTARMALGFSDDEQRSSLALLVVATNDVAKALDIQRTAMDLARLTGVDLDTATAALIKTEDGGFRLLKSLGIQIDANATSEEALTAVRKAATGQAAAYASTTSGKLLVAQTKIGDKMEALGGVIMPLVADALDSISNAIDLLSGDPTKKLTGGLKAIADAVGVVINAIKTLVGWIGDAIGAINTMANALHKLNQDIAKNVARAQNRGPFDPGDLPRLPHKASGGWVGLRGPEVALVGEQGPEYVIPNNRLGRSSGGTGFTIQGVSERDIVAMVDKGLYFKLRRAAPTVGRV